MNAQDLLKREDEGWLEFRDAFAAVPFEQREVEGVVPGWSTHDLVWHVGYWAGYAADVIDRIRAGESELEPGESDLEEAVILAMGRRMGWDEIILRAEQGRERARAALSSLEALTSAAIEWFEDDTFDHYEEHGAQIRAFRTRLA
jgi:hypothetical protein